MQCTLKIRGLHEWPVAFDGSVVEQNCLRQQNKKQNQKKDFQDYFLLSSDVQVEGIMSEPSLSKGSPHLQFVSVDLPGSFLLVNDGL